MKTGNVVIGTLAGLAAGALIGVLFAPDKGSESRHKIVKKSEDYMDSIKRRFNSLLDTISGKYNGGRVDVADVHENGSSEDTVREMQASAT
jgi:gas vesicle protein